MILSATVFCKTIRCPSSEALLEFGASHLVADQRVLVEAHLGECEFCGAELQLLSCHVPAADEECPIADMPLSLRQLAQGLLCVDRLGLESIGELGCEKERFTLTDA